MPTDSPPFGTYPNDKRVEALHTRIGALTEERDALAALVIAYAREVGERFGDPGFALTGELAVVHYRAMEAAANAR